MPAVHSKNLSHELIPDSPDAEDVLGMGRIVLDLPPNIGDMTVYSSRRDGDVFFPPDPVEKIIASENLALFLDEQPQHMEFQRGQLEFLSPAQQPSPPPATTTLDLREAVQQLEKSLILRALREAGGNRTKAAGLLGISRRALFRKITPP